MLGYRSRWETAVSLFVPGWIYKDRKHCSTKLKEWKNNHSPIISAVATCKLESTRISICEAMLRCCERVLDWCSIELGVGSDAGVFGTEGGLQDRCDNRGYSAIHPFLEEWKKVVELPMKSGRSTHRQNPCCPINPANSLRYHANRCKHDLP